MNVKRPTLILLLALACATQLRAQDSASALSDTVVSPIDSAAIWEQEAEERIKDQEKAEQAVLRAPADSATVNNRSFSAKRLEELRKDPELQYKEEATVAESLFDRFMKWLSRKLASLVNKSITTNWGRVVIWIVALAVIAAIILAVLKVDAFNMFFLGRRANAINHNVFEENIHEMNFEKLIQEAIDQNDYRRGVRLVFLYALKLLADRQLIHWEQGKTNHDYVAELNAGELRNGLSDLSFYFDYAWYGNFTINRELFTKVNDTFAHWKTKL